MSWPPENQPEFAGRKKIEKYILNQYCLELVYSRARWCIYSSSPEDMLSAEINWNTVGAEEPTWDYSGFQRKYGDPKVVFKYFEYEITVKVVVCYEKLRLTRYASYFVSSGFAAEVVQVNQSWSASRNVSTPITSIIVYRLE